MSHPGPSAPSPFPFEAFATHRLRDREAEKRGLWKGILALLKSTDLIERAGYCPITLTGLVIMFARLLDEPGMLAEAYEIGLIETAGFAELTPEVTVEPLQVISGTEPGRPLLERLAAEDFRRMTAPGVEPVIYMGRGTLAGWKTAQTPDVRVTRCELPGGAIHGLGVLVEGAESSKTQLDDAKSEVRETTGGDLRRTRPYTSAKVSAPADRESWRLYLATDAEHDALMQTVVAQQGPIDLDNAIETVRLELGLRSIRSTCRTKLANALDRLKAASVVIETAGGFYHAPGLPVLPRDRTGCSERLRRLAALPPVEVDAAICHELAARGPTDDEAGVVVGAALRLGYPLKSSATNPALAALVAERLEGLVNGGVAIRGAGGLALATTSDPAEDSIAPEVGGWADAGAWPKSIDPPGAPEHCAGRPDDARREVGHAGEGSGKAGQPPALRAAE